MGILNPDYSPQIELVDFGSEAFIEATELPCKQLVTSYKCPKGFAADPGLLLKYSQLAFGEYCIVHYAKFTDSGVLLTVIYEDRQYEINVYKWNFDVFGVAQQAFAKSIAADLVPVAPPRQIPNRLIYVDFK